jgi:hypothetical protein
MPAEGPTFQLTAILSAECQEPSFSCDGLGVCRWLTEALPVAIDCARPALSALLVLAAVEASADRFFQAAKLLTHGTARLLMARSNGRRLEHSQGIKSPGTVCTVSVAISVSSTDTGSSIGGTWVGV